jgi:hypothetical protein
VVALAAGVFALFGGLFLVTQLLQFSFGFSALEAGLLMLPTSVGLIAGAALSRVVGARAGTRVPAAGGLVGVAAGMAAVALSARPGGTYLDQLPGLVLIGAGTGLFLPACTSAVLATLPPRQAGVGSAVNSTAQQVGGAVGVAVLGSVLAARYRHAMGVALAAHSLPASARTVVLGSVGGALGVAAGVGGDTGDQLAAAARAAFLSGYRSSALVGAAVTVAAGVLVLLAYPTRTGPCGAER